MKPTRKKTKQVPLTYKVREATELLDFLMKAKDGISRNSVKSLLAHRQVLVDNIITTQYNYPLKPGMEVKISREKGKKEFRSNVLKILYEDAYLLIVDKKEGLPVIDKKPKERTAHSLLSEHVQRSGKQYRVYPVNRLDKDASGIMIFAKDEKTKINLQDYWDQAVKEYRFVAILSGEIENDKGAVSSWLVDEKLYIAHAAPSINKDDKAVTRYKTIKRANGYSMVELETTRRNQARLHTNDLKHPVLGDAIYNPDQNPLGRLALHAFKLRLQHPVSGEMLEFKTAYPTEFKNLMLKRAE